VLRKTRKAVAAIVAMMTVTIYSAGARSVQVAAASKPNGLIAKQIANVGDSVCAVTSAGAVKCWGGSLFGREGETENFYAGQPVTIPGLESGVVSIPNLRSYSNTGCAIMTNGNVKCWGEIWKYESTAPNAQRITVNRLQATDIGLQLRQSPSSILSVDANQICFQTPLVYRQCRALDPNTLAQIDNRIVPMPSVQVRSFASVWREILWNWNSPSVVYGSGDCFVSTEQNLHCYGQTASDSPSDWQLGSRGVKDAEGNCLVTTENALSCYDDSRRKVVEVISSDVDFVSGACAALLSGGVKCWGNGNPWAYIGEPVTYLTDKVKEIVGSCAVTTKGKLKCWGDFDVDLPGIINPRQLLVTYGLGGCAITNIGGVKCWGDNSQGKLGNGNEEITYDLVDVIGFVHEEIPPTTSTTIQKSSVSSSSTSTLPSESEEDEDWRPGETPNGVTVEVNGSDVAAQLRVVSGDLVLESEALELTIGGEDLGAQDFFAESESPIHLRHADVFDLTVEKLEPDSEVKARMFSTPVTLGNEDADQSGAVTMRIRIPKELPAGQHSLVLNATSANHRPIVLVLGVVVADAAGGIDLTVVALIVLAVGILGAILLPAARSRKLKITRS